MDQQKIISIGLPENQLEFQPLSTFDLDDEIAPQNVGVFAMNEKNSNQINEKPIRPDICCEHVINRIKEEPFAIYEKGAEEKTFHNAEVEKRSHLCNDEWKSRTSGICHIAQDYQSVAKQLIDNDALKDEPFNPEYYEELLFMNGKMSIVSNMLLNKPFDHKKFIINTMDDNISDEYEEIQIEEARYQNQSVIDAVSHAKGGDKVNIYENVEHLNGKAVSRAENCLAKQSVPSEDMYAIARRFPSFRVMGAIKKHAKRANGRIKCNKTSSKSVRHTINHNTNIANVEIKDPVYSRPKKWNFICRRNLKDQHLGTESAKNTFKNSPSKR